MDLALFDVVGEAVRGMAPTTFGTIGVAPRSYGIKVWCQGARPGPEHYEAQLVGAHLAPSANVLGLEVGFHAEHRDETKNDAAVDRIALKQRSWRKTLGPEPEIDSFLGSAQHWRRISEIWPDPDLSDESIGLEIASRLVDYLTAFEPIRQG